MSLSVTFGIFGDLPLLTLYSRHHVISRMKTLKVRIEPNSAQRKVIDHNIEANRYVFNALVTACKQVHNKTDELPSVFDLNKLTTRMRNNSPFLGEALAMTFMATSVQVFRACKKTLDTHKREGGTLTFEPYRFRMRGDRFPRFRTGGGSGSYTYPVYKRDFSIVTEKRNGKKRRLLRLGKVPGLIRCYNQETRIDGKIKTCTIKRKDMGSHYEYYACITYEETPKPYKDPLKDPVGVDLGISNIAALSDGTKFPNDRIFSRMYKKVAKIQKQMSRALYGSEYYNKLQTKLNHTYEKIENHRKNNIENISVYIVKNHDFIGMENLSVRALRKKSENRFMTNGYNDASLGALIRRIKDKASSAGREIILVPPKDTSQLCSKCGSMVKKDLSVRVHRCPHCGYTEDRDVNASRNVFQRALRLKIQGMGRPSLSR